MICSLFFLFLNLPGMGYNVTLQGASCSSPLQQQYRYALKFCYIYVIIVNMSVMLVISQLTVPVCDH